MVKKIETNKQLIQEEKIKCVNLTGIPDEELYGPDFLCEETEFCTEKKIISTNPVGMKQEPSYSSESDNKFDISDMDDIVQCAYCGEGVPSDEEQHHINIMHQDEDEEIDEYEAPDNSELRKLAREVRDINDAMNDLSSSTMADVRSIKAEISKVNHSSMQHFEEVKADMLQVTNGVGKDITAMDIKIGKIENLFPKNVNSINLPHEKLDTINDDLEDIKQNVNSINLIHDKLKTTNDDLEDIKQF